MSAGVIQIAAPGTPVVRTPALLRLWSLYPVLLPFYFMGRTMNPGTHKFESGVPQVADYFFAAFMVLALFRLPFRLPRATLPVVTALAGFVGYVGVVNFAWAGYLEDASLLKNTLFYVYDCLLLLTCLLLYREYQDEFLKVTVYAVAASVLLQAVLSPLAIDRSQSRQALFFNDENQLGYYCVLAATIFALGSRRVAIPAAFRALFYLAVGYLALLSQCRGGLLALGVLTVVALLGKPFRLLLAGGGLAAAAVVLTMQPSVIGKAEERLVTAGEYDSAETRGYDRIANYPEHLVLGAGEGAYQRFRSALFASEIHSSYGTLLFCYGIIGTLLFSAALFWLIRADVRSALFLIPAFAYGTAHQGIRAAFFWAMLAVLTCIALCPSHPERKAC